MYKTVLLRSSKKIAHLHRRSGQMKGKVRWEHDHFENGLVLFGCKQLQCDCSQECKTSALDLNGWQEMRIAKKVDLKWICLFDADSNEKQKVNLYVLSRPFIEQPGQIV